MKTKLKKGRLLCLLAMFCVICIGAFADMEVYNMEGYDPVSGTWIAGDGTGSQSHAQSTSIYHNGLASLMWRYVLPSPVGDNWPTIEMLVPAGKDNWSGGTGLSVWMYFDLTGTKYNWTIEPIVCHPFPTIDTLGNWNSDPGGVPAATWTEHTWDLTGIGDISSCSHLRFTYHSGDGWEALAIGGNVDIYLDDISVVGVTEETDNDLFDMEAGDPITNMWIGGGGEGSQSHSQSTTFAHGGSASVLLRYTLPADPSGDYPQFEMAIPGGQSNWTGGTALSAWMFFDLTGLKNFWTIQPSIQHPWPTGTDLGNWNCGGNGVAPMLWTQHSWDLTGAGDISNVTHLSFYYHGGDGWQPLAKGGNIDIYLDDIGVVGADVPVEDWDLY